MRSRPVYFTNNLNQKLSGIIYENDPPSERGVIYCHGFFSSKNGHNVTRLAPSIVGAGFSLLAFDFSYAGESEGTFSDFSILQEVEDLKSAASFFIDQGIESLHLIGSSMGGVVALLMAALKHPRVRSLSLIATPVKLDELMGNLLPAVKLDDLPAGGSTDVQGVSIKNSFFSEALSIDMTRALDSVDVPVLMIHGARDAVVDISNACIVDGRIKTRKQTVLIEDGDHNLSRDRDLATLVDAIIPWISAHGGTPLYKPIR